MIIESFNWKQFKIEIHNSLPNFPFERVNQVHGNKVVKIDSTIDNVDADGMMSDLLTPFKLGIKTADCLPIFLMNEKNGFSAIHAGWRGLHSKILDSEKLIKLAPKKVYIGPHIKECCYEVGPEFEDIFAGFVKYNGRTRYFSLLAKALSQIKSNFKDCEIISSSLCTHCEQKLHSFRRNETFERNWNIISVRN